MTASIIPYLQIASGLCWLLPMVLFIPSVWRVWTSPSEGPGRVDPVDVMVSPFAFIAAIQVGFTIRWLLWPTVIRAMRPDELGVWAGLYTLSMIAAVASVRAWRIARRI